MKCPKVYALYLPQYYETENNNKWWGKGYTEWVAVKKAEACFENHEQPVIPLDEKYYTLSDPETNMEWMVSCSIIIILEMGGRNLKDLQKCFWKMKIFICHFAFTGLIYHG